MTALLQAYSLEQIIIFVALLIFAIRGFIDGFEHAYKRIKAFIEKIEQPNKNKIQLEKQKQENEAIQKTLSIIVKEVQEFKNRLNRQQQAITAMQQTLNKTAKAIDSLIESDRNAIKAYITERHHYFVYQQKWIDDYSLECLQKRFEQYQLYGGNSFVSKLMSELRELPREQRGSRPVIVPINEQMKTQTINNVPVDMRDFG